LPGDQKSWQIQTSTGDVVKLVNKDQYWRLYDNVWSLLIAMNGRGTASGSFQLSAASSPTLGQRARGLVESLNMPAAEMAAAVVSSGLGVVGISSSLNKQQGEKTSRLRGERCPRVVFRLVLLYLYHADLESTSRCVQQFLALLPVFLSTESEQNKNRLQLLLWYMPYLLNFMKEIILMMCNHLAALLVLPIRLAEWLLIMYLLDLVVPT
jgi:hypothetical protein